MKDGFKGLGLYFIIITVLMLVFVFGDFYQPLGIRRTLAAAISPEARPRSFSSACSRAAFSIV